MEGRKTTGIGEGNMENKEGIKKRQKEGRKGGRKGRREEGRKAGREEGRKGGKGGMKDRCILYFSQNQTHLCPVSSGIPVRTRAASFHSCSAS